jgi:hypothetical protein
LLCIASVVVIILHIAAGYFGFFGAVGRPSLAFALPVTVGLLVVCGLGIWLGWIMATTKEVAPPPLETKTEKEAAEGKKK